MDLNAHLWEIVIGGLITALAVINAYFIKQLVKKIEENAQSVSGFSKELAVLSSKVDQLSNMQTRLSMIEKQMAVFEYIFKRKDSFQEKEEG